MNNETQNENTKQSNRPTHTIYSVKEINGKKYYNTHGVAFEHANGEGMNVLLNLFGLEIQMTIFKNKEKN